MPPRYKIMKYLKNSEHPENLKKVKYWINILPMVGMYVENGKIVNPTLSIMSSLADTDELSVFSTEAVSDLI